MHQRTYWITLVVFLVLAPSALAADDGEIADRARELRGKGRYTDALAVLGRAESKADPEVAAEHAELLLETGRYEEAGRVATAAGEDLRCRTLRAESLWLRGKTAEATKIVDAVIEADPERPRARFLAATMLREAGKREEAAEGFAWFFDYHAMNDLKDAEALTLVALASLRLTELMPDVQMEFGPAMKILDSVTGVKGIRGIDEGYLPAYAVKAEIYLAVYQDKSAKKELLRALAKNPRYPPALYWHARQLDFEWDSAGGVARCEEALASNPSFAEAHEFIATVRIGDRQFADAERHLDAVLSVNPNRRPAAGLKATIRFLKGDRKGFDADAKKLLATNPKFSRVYRDLAGVLEQQRRFEEACEWAKKAVEVDAEDFLAWWMVGRNLVHRAKEEEALAALKKSRSLDPGGHYKEAFRHNMIEVLGHLEEFAESRSPNFRYKIHVGENTILSRYYHRFMELSWDTLTKRYEFEPEGPILTEVFHNHQDFAARTIGLPGIGALGACFGKVITLDSPSARKPGEFGWASTAHHEFAHVVTLQLSKGRVPRWFTEGLSVYEERQFADWWERDMDRVLFDRWSAGEIYPILKFNRTFRGRDVMFAYYLGGMMCEFIVEEFGFPKILEMLEAYGKDRQTAQVLSEVLGVTANEYDERFRKWVGKYVGKYRLIPRISRKGLVKLRERVADHPKDAAALAKIAWAYYQRDKDVDAMAWLGKAMDVEPARPDVLALRGRLAMKSGRADHAENWYGKYLEAGGDDHDTRMHLAKSAEEENEFEAAIAHYEAARDAFPRSPGAWAALVRMKKGEGDLPAMILAKESLARLLNTDIRIRLELSSYYEETEDWAKLAEILTQVVRIYPLAMDEDTGFTVHARLAGALSRVKRHEEAAMEYEVALELGVAKGVEAGVRADLGETLRLLGRTADAKFHAEAALEIDPECEPAKELLERLRGK
ncbi:MAG: tetratricopeptide repeat protein [Planctomycetota bacterium]